MARPHIERGDTVALVTYAGSTRVVLEPTGLEHRDRILEAIDELSAGGSTAMASGLDLAYGLAVRRVARDATSRVIVLSDGDANVGRTSHQAMLESIAEHVRRGVFLSTVGFGQGNYQDTTMEQLADRGNGTSYYIDSDAEARRVFQEQLSGTLEVVAQDVKVQVEFDPEAVRAYRLVGYENRDVADRDFRDDAVDAGEIGAGHQATAFYEIELVPGSRAPLATVRVRAKRPGGTQAREWIYPFQPSRMSATFASASIDLRFGTAVVGFAELLRRSPHAEDWSLDTVREIARAASPSGNQERQEFLRLLGLRDPLRAAAR